MTSEFYASSSAISTCLKLMSPWGSNLLGKMEENDTSSGSFINIEEKNMLDRLKRQITTMHYKLTPFLMIDTFDGKSTLS